MLNRWLGPRKTEEERQVGSRKTEEEHRVGAVVWHNPPGVAKRLGDMSVEELRAELAQIHGHLRAGGTILINPEDSFQRVYFFE